MNYDQLKAPIPRVPIELGRDRTAEAKMLSAAEQLAIHRSVPEPEVPIVGESPLGEPIRDDGSPEYETKFLFWQLKQAALTVAVAIGFEPDGIPWVAGHLIEPDGPKNDPSGPANTIGFSNAEDQRRAYARRVVVEFIGDGSVQGLFSKDEIVLANRQVQQIGMGELIGQSAEGNSSSGEGQETAQETVQEAGQTPG